MITIGMYKNSIVIDDEMLIKGEGNTIEEALKDYCNNVLINFSNEKDKEKKENLRAKISSVLFDSYLFIIMQNVVNENDDSDLDINNNNMNGGFILN